MTFNRHPSRLLHYIIGRQQTSISIEYARWNKIPINGIKEMKEIQLRIECHWMLADKIWTSRFCWKHHKAPTDELRPYFRQKAFHPTCQYSILVLLMVLVGALNHGKLNIKIQEPWRNLTLWCHQSSEEKRLWLDRKGHVENKELQKCHFPLVTTKLLNITNPKERMCSICNSIHQLNY